MPIIESRNILLATAGTWGDLLPLVELGKRLQARGHRVAVACSSGHHDWITRSDLEPIAFDGDFGKDVAQKHARAWDHWRRRESRRCLDHLMAEHRVVSRNAAALSRLARDFDLLLMPSHCPEGPRASESSGIPYVPVVFMPEDGLTDRRGFSKFPGALFACSAALGVSPFPHVTQTGFWFYEDPRWSEWRPDALLKTFMAEDPPLVLSFSSLPLEDPAQVLALHARAARILGLRLVVQQGWAGFSLEQLPEDIDPAEIHLADFLPHDWFLAKAAALITHGGIGTLGRALRNGCPVLIEPYGNDQFYNALLFKKLGYATAVHPHRITSDGLARLLDERVLCADAETRDRRERAAQIIRGEDGVGAACDWIDRCLEGIGREAA